jgi:predicted metal-dependent hydrolase
MIPRKLKIDFAGVPMHWTRIPEFAAMQNAGSPIATQSEIFVNAVMAKLRGLLPDDQAELRDEIDIFVRQETNHCYLHADFNKEMYARGYGAVRELEARMRDYYRRLLKERSLAFNLAYCAGFENIALFSAKFAFIAAPDLFEGGDQRMVDLFKWHLAEEFEHRCVAHAAFAAHSGNYFLRIRGALEAFRSLNRFQSDILNVILEVDRQNLTPAQVKESKRRLKQLQRRLALYVLPRLVQILRPYYDPAKHEMTPDIRSALHKYEAMAEAAA